MVKIEVFELNNMAMLDMGEVHYLSNLLRQAAGRLPSDRHSMMTNDNITVMLTPKVNPDDVNRLLTRWARKRYKRFKRSLLQARKWLKRISERNPNLFYIWSLDVKP